ncbi:MAG TPA: enoyl-CoA hydratase/isomerase family protein, partial [Acidimicrobiia bacterium]|nr:enoyl-CoA hydratase/isomerase family protein [Acidimicrobiia bacterium]
MKDLRVEVDGGVAVWTIDRAAERNSIGGTLLADLLEAAADAAADDRIRAVVTAAEGPTWCVGADLADLAGQTGAPLEDLLHGSDVGGEKGLPPLTGTARSLDRLGIGQWVLALRRLEKPLIAAVEGPVAGGGLALLALHDVRIASASARFAAGFATAGVGPEMGLSWFLPRLVAPGTATDLLLSGRVVDAEEAAAIGLVQRVVLAGRAREEAIVYAERLCRLP